MRFVARRPRRMGVPDGYREKEPTDANYQDRQMGTLTNESKKVIHSRGSRHHRRLYRMPGRRPHPFAAWLTPPSDGEDLGGCSEPSPHLRRCSTHWTREAVNRHLPGPGSRPSTPRPRPLPRCKRTKFHLVVRFRATWQSQKPSASASRAWYKAPITRSEALVPAHL